MTTRVKVNFRPQLQAALMGDRTDSTHDGPGGVARVTRRGFCAAAPGAIAGLTFTACLAKGEQDPPRDIGGRLTARPRDGRGAVAAAGTRALGLDRDRDAILRLPANASAAPLALLVLLHGAGGRGAGILRRLGAAADEAGLAVLAPDSRQSTWDVIRGEFGADVRFLNRALERMFETVAVDPARVSIGGFSDGASYALSLGVINGDLFRRIVAFSPGFIVEGTRRGSPEVFISHGRTDDILPIASTSRRIVPRLRARGYDVTVREFDGGHDVPAAIAQEGMRWAVGPPRSAALQGCPRHG